MSPRSMIERRLMSATPDDGHYMKTILTHVRPHIDDICGAWLVKKYLPGWRSARLKFVTATTLDPKRSDVVCIGMGRGRFDEHKGNIGESAASLVWKTVRRRARNAEERAALELLVRWVQDEDQSLHAADDPEMGPSAQLYYYFLRQNFLPDVTSGRGGVGDRDAWIPPLRLPPARQGGEIDDEMRSEASTAFGFEILENALLAYRSRVRLDQAWRRRIDFITPWGKAAGVVTDESGADDYAYRKGYALVVLVRPAKGYRQFRASPRSKVNLSVAYRKLLEIDARADWFLHHTHKLLLSGSDVAPELRTSKMTLKELIAIVSSS